MGKARQLRGPNPLDEPVIENDSRIFEIADSSGEVTRAKWRKSGRAHKTDALYFERRSTAINFRVTPTIERILRERARMHCNGNLSEWMVWAALEFSPRRRRIVVNADH